MEKELTKFEPKEIIEKIIEKTHKDLQKYVKESSDNFVFGSDNCSEAIATSIAHYENLPETTYKKFVSGFGKGIAGKGETCGALLTGISFISKFASEKGYSKKEIREFASMFYNEFTKEFGSNLCKDLSGHDCDQPFQKDFDLHTCGVYISFATKYALEFAEKLKENQKN